jgi:cell division protein FtsN
MSQQNRRNRRSEYISPTCPPGWAWLLAGILIGMFISFLIYLREFAPQNLPPESAQVTNPSITNTKENDPVTPPLEFYEKLPKPETPNTAGTKGEEKQASQPELPITAPGRYLLQVGSFQDELSAKGLKGYLVSIGIPAHIEITGLSETGRWYRVQVGPFTDLDKLNQTRSLLAKNNITAILRKF